MIPGPYTDNAGRMITHNSNSTFIAEVINVGKEVQTARSSYRWATVKWTEKVSWIERLFGRVDITEEERYVQSNATADWINTTIAVTAPEYVSVWLNDRYNAITTSRKDRFRRRHRALKENSCTSG